VADKDAEDVENGEGFVVGERLKEREQEVDIVCFAFSLLNILLRVHILK